MAERIRDRTLVLRVLPPALQARLRDKMYEAERIGLTNPAATASSHGQVEDLEGVSVRE